MVRIGGCDGIGIFVACGFVIDGRYAACGDVRIFFVDDRIEHRRTFTGGESRLKQFDKFRRALPRYVYRNIRMGFRKFAYVSVFEFLTVGIFMRPKFDNDVFLFFYT